MSLIKPVDLLTVKIYGNVFLDTKSPKDVMSCKQKKEEIGQQQNN